MRDECRFLLCLVTLATGRVIQKFYRERCVHQMNVIIFQENVRSLAWESTTADASETERLGEATAKFLRKLSDHGRAPWPAILKWSEETHAIEVPKKLADATNMADPTTSTCTF